MTQRPNTLDTVLCTIELLRRIPRHRKTSATELRQQLADAGFQRDIRTIQRHLDALCRQFADLECDTTSKPYGYRWTSHSHGLNLPTLNEQESLLLLLAKQHLAQLLPPSVLSFMEPFFEQAHRKLNVDGSGKPEHEWLDKAAVVPTSQPLLPPKLGEGVLYEASRALYNNCKLKLRYRNQHGYESEHTVLPMALAQQGKVLYLVVYFEGHSDIRHLALHRILWAEAGTLKFVRPPDFDFRRHIEQGAFGFGLRQRIRLRFSISRSVGFHLTETPLSADQSILAESEIHYRFQATLYDSGMLDWWLRKFGDDIWDIERETLSADSAKPQNTR